MNLPTEIFGNVVVIHSPEELVAEQAELFQNYLSRQELQNIVLDLDNTEALDSTGLTALLDVQTGLREKSGDLKIATTNNDQSQNPGSHPARRTIGSVRQRDRRGEELSMRTMLMTNDEQ